MYTNNQTKTAQIKSKKVSPFGTLKKVKSKDTPFSKQKITIKLQSQQKRNKNNAILKQFAVQNKSKGKNSNTKNIQQQYYIQQKQIDKQKRAWQLDKCSKNQIRTSSACNQKSNKKLEQNKNKQNDINSKIAKLKLTDSKYVINFDGKMIKMPPNAIDTRNHYYTSISNSEYGTNQLEFTNYIKQKRKSKSKSKVKRLKKTNSGTSSALNLKNVQRNYTSRQDFDSQRAGWGGLEYELSHKNNVIPQSTQISPFRQNKQYERNEVFDYDQIDELIEEDLESCNEIKIQSNLSQARKQCIKLMSELCGEIMLRRQTFYLAISIFDRAISKNLKTKNYILVALVSLTLAMKLEQAQLSLQFVYVLGVVSNERQSYLQSVKSNKSPQKSVDKHHSKGKKSDKKIKLQLKPEDIRKINASGIAKILKEYKCNKISKTDFMELQSKITIYLRFRLWRIQAIYWADLLTCMWDQTIMSTELKKMNSISLLFRYPESLANLSYLYQILEMAYTDLSVYKFPAIYIVLSTLFLLVRIPKQNIERGFQLYRNSLSNSTNILFADDMGINQIFWSFIQKLNLEISSILDCCKFISVYLKPKLMKSTIIYDQNKDSIDNQLCIHKYNSDLYTDNIK